MKNLLVMLLAAGSLLFSARAQQLTTAEYFFDTDPGVGNGTALSVTPGDTLNFSGTIPATGLADGFHLLHIRAKDSNGKWSLSERRTFLVQTIVPSGQLAEAEYFFDTDPGTGNGTALTVTGGDTISFTGFVPSGSLSPGFHSLIIRTRSADGRWSLYERRVFHIDPVPGVIPMLVAAEYFVDTDPGFGSGTPISVTSGDSLDFTGALPVATVDTGSHILYIRAMDAMNRWSLYEPRTFQISLSAGLNNLPHADAGLFQNYPNPFSRTTTVEYYLKQPGDVTFYILDYLGRVVKEIRSTGHAPGMHTVTFDHLQLSAGNYFYKMVAGDFVDVKKMTLVN
jgi:hypothetical protein